MTNRAWSIVDIAALLLIPVTIAAASFWERVADLTIEHPVWIWLWMGLLLLTHAAALGLSKDRGLLGVLVDETNRVSLARFQAAIWGAILVTGLAAAVAINLGRDCQVRPEGTTPAAGACNESALAIEIPSQLLVLAGISAATFGASVIVDGQHAQRESRRGRRDGSGRRIDDIATRMADNGYRPVGIIAAKTLPEKATLGDLVRGDLETTYQSLDLSRIQFMVLSIVLGGAYAVLFAQGLDAHLTRAVGFPPLEESLDVLLGISGAVYVGSKAVQGASA